MAEYNINKNTLALVPLGKKKTIVYEDHECLIFDEKVDKLMDESCKYHGSTISGRIKGTQKLTGYSYKSPIIVKEEEKLIFFPTCSPRLKDCAWINANSISKIYNKDDKCLIEFDNSECLEVDVSYNIINNQISKSLVLEKNFEKRNK